MSPIVVKDQTTLGSTGLFKILIGALCSVTGTWCITSAELQQLQQL